MTNIRGRAVLLATAGVLLAALIASPVASAALPDTSTSHGLVATTAKAKTKYKVTTKATPKTVKKLATFTITGSVKPKAAGKKVTLQRYSGGKWHAVTTVKLSKTSTYRFSRKATALGSVKYRVHKAGGKYAAGTSKSVTVKTVRSVASMLTLGKPSRSGAAIYFDVSLHNTSKSSVKFVWSKLQLRFPDGTIRSPYRAGSGSTSTVSAGGYLFDGANVYSNTAHPYDSVFQPGHYVVSYDGIVLKKATL